MDFSREEYSQLRGEVESGLGHKVFIFQGPRFQGDGYRFLITQDRLNGFEQKMPEIFDIAERQTVGGSVIFRLFPRRAGTENSATAV